MPIWQHLREGHQVLQAQVREGGCQWLQATSCSNSANPNKIGKKAVGGNDSFMVIFRKETKKKCKQEHTLHFGTKSRSLGEKNLPFFLPLVLSPDAGEGLPGLVGALGCLCLQRSG